MNPETPRCRCRHCSHVMHAVWQPPLMKGRAGMWLLTCHNWQCALYQYTFSEANYPTVDLSVYVKEG